MKIGINTLFFIPGKVGGTEIFLRNQIDQLSKIDKKNKYVIFANNENARVFSNLPSNFSVIRCPIDASNRTIRILWEQVVLPFQCLAEKIDLLHSPGYTAPILTFCRKVTTIFDLNYHFYPQDTSWMQLLVYRMLIPLSAQASDKIVVHSYKSKDELSKVLKIDKTKIVVIYPGVSAVFFERWTKTRIENTLSKYGIKRPFILSNAVSHPHKNLLSLVKAYSILVEKDKLIPNLVLLGFAGREQGLIDKTIGDKNISYKVSFTGWVEPKDVPAFYKAASIFVFPSLYEGFGLPLIESMASGTVLLTSKYSCIPEVVDSGGLIIDTKKPDLIAENIRKLLRSEKLRSSLILKGIQRAKLFRWEIFGKELYNLYNSFNND